jgi:hypothetical protein
MPGSFDIFVYTVQTGFLTGGVSFPFTANLSAGTYVAGLGVGDNGKQPFSTPYTTVGLVVGSTGGPGGGGGDVGGAVPEPSSIMLLGSALLGTFSVLRKKLIRS